MPDYRTDTRWRAAHERYLSEAPGHADAVAYRRAQAINDMHAIETEYEDA